MVEEKSLGVILLKYDSAIKVNDWNSNCQLFGSEYFFSLRLLKTID